MKRSYKFQLLKSEAMAALAATSTITGAAQKIGVCRSTLQRWLRAGKLPPLPPPPLPPLPPPPPAPAPRRSARAARQGSAAWARWVRRAYELSPVEAQLLSMAEEARRIAQDRTVAAHVRLAAMGRCAALVRQLNLEEEDRGQAETEQSESSNVGPWPKAAG